MRFSPPTPHTLLALCAVLIFPVPALPRHNAKACTERSGITAEVEPAAPLATPD